MSLLLTDRPNHDRVGDVAFDGRHARSQRSQAAIVDAFLDLLREGVRTPSTAEIAERAGVTQRTLFNQFGDVATLVGHAASRQAERLLERLPAIDSSLPIEQRLARYAAGQAALLEDIAPVRWAALTCSAPGDAIELSMVAVRDLMRSRLGALLRPELTGVDPAVRERVLDALECETDAGTWYLRRNFQGLSMAEATSAMHTALVAVARTLR